MAFARLVTPLEVLFEVIFFDMTSPDETPGHAMNGTKGTAVARNGNVLPADCVYGYSATSFPARAKRGSPESMNTPQPLLHGVALTEPGKAAFGGRPGF